MQTSGQMKHALRANNAHLDPLSQGNAPSNTHSLPPANARATHPASSSISNHSVEPGKILHPGGMRELQLSGKMQATAYQSSHHLCYDWLFMSHAFFCTGAQQAASGSSPSHRGRLRRFEDELAANHINIKQLRRLAFHGIPEKEGLRATTWKVCCPKMSSHSVLLCRVLVHELMCVLIDHVLTSKEAQRSCKPSMHGPEQRSATGGHTTSQEMRLCACRSS